MICLICGKDYVSVGVHAKRKHGVSPDEYRQEFGMLKTAPLIDESLSLHLSTMAKITFAGRDDEEKEEIRQLCRDNAAQHGCPKGSMSEAGVAMLAARNKARNDSYLAAKAPTVDSIISSSAVSADVRRALGMGHQAVLAMDRAGLVNYDREKAEAERLRRVAVTVEKRREPKIDAVIALYDSKLSLAEICRQVEVPSTTYKRWRTAGLIPNRKTYIKSPA